jgi:PAS domain S-box-containing protein
MEEEKTEENIFGTNKNIDGIKKYIEDFMYFLPLAFCVVDSSGIIRDNNQALQEVTGYRKDELIGRNVSFLFENKLQIESFLIRSATKKERIEEEMLLFKEDYRKIPVKISALSREDSMGNFRGYFLTISDLSESKKLEEELREMVKERTTELETTKERLEELGVILEVRIRARMEEMEELNDKLEEKVQERTKEIGEKAMELERSTEEMRKTQTALLNLAEDTNNASREAEKEKEKTMAIISNIADGLFLFDLEKKLVLANPKAQEIFDVKIRDIELRTTRELKTFPTLKKLIEIVGEEVKEVFRQELQMESGAILEVTTTPIWQENKNTGTLVNVHDITREKGIEKIKSEFVSVAAHQLRTPLAGIKWTLQTILEEAEEANIPEEIVGFIGKAYEANDRMVHLVNDLLNVSRIEEGRYIYEPEETDFMEIVNPIIETYKENLKAKGLEFEIKRTKETLPVVKVDKEKMGMVIQNYLDNAMKYTKKGKVTLAIEHIDGKIKVSVSDTGVGIPEDQQKRLFGKFFRAANVQIMDTEGSGLGLFITKNIVEAHGGTVGFTSKEGEGSTFYFTLPANKEEIDSFFKAF